MDIPTQHSNGTGTGTCICFMRKLRLRGVRFLLRAIDQVCCRLGFEPVRLPNQGAFRI